jgi:hypothetical protein
MASLLRIATLGLLIGVLPAMAQQKATQPPPKKEPTRTEAVRQEVAQKVDAIRAYSETQRKEALARARTALEDADRRIETLQASADERRQTISQSARTRLDAALHDIRKKRNEVSEWYGGMQHGSSAAWDEVKTGFIESYHALSESMRRAREQFEKERAATGKEQDGQ